MKVSVNSDRCGAPVSRSLTVHWKPTSSPRAIVDRTYVRKTRTMKCTVTGGLLQRHYVGEQWSSRSKVIKTYWIGTFAGPTSTSEPYTWTSQRDVEATKSALLASSGSRRTDAFR